MPRLDTLEFVLALHQSSEVVMIHIGEQQHRSAITLLQSRLDKDWSLCDAVSFEIMRIQNISDALTTDHHFEQAGYRSLLRV